MAIKQASPLRVWVFALVILTILATLGGILMAVWDEPFPLLTNHGTVDTACQAVTVGSLVSRPWA